jgi:hypothetical protein
LLGDSIHLFGCAKIDQFLAEIIAEWICHQVHEVLDDLFKGSFDKVSVVRFELLLEETAAIMITCQPIYICGIDLVFLDICDGMCRILLQNVRLAS